MHPAIYASTTHQHTLQSKQQLTSNALSMDILELIISFKTGIILILKYTLKNTKKSQITNYFQTRNNMCLFKLPSVRAMTLA
jgi:uncharacterized membrane protein affecting hemolysin expression